MGSKASEKLHKACNAVKACQAVVPSPRILSRMGGRG